MVVIDEEACPKKGASRHGQLRFLVPVGGYGVLVVYAEVAGMTPSKCILYIRIIYNLYTYDSTYLLLLYVYMWSEVARKGRVGRSLAEQEE